MPAWGTARATDEIPGLGRLEQLMLRTDGLTTTSMEVLIGARIDVEVVEHWILPLHADVHAMSASDPDYTGIIPPEVAAGVDRSLVVLDARPEETLLMREILHRGDDGARYGAAAVAVVLDRLPTAVARVLAGSDEPIGRALRAAGVMIERELLTWGLEPAGDRAHRLTGSVEPWQPVPAREYVMRLSDQGVALGLFSEWFAPCLFAPSPTVSRRRRRRDHGQQAAR